MRSSRIASTSPLPQDRRSATLRYTATKSSVSQLELSAIKRSAGGIWRKAHKAPVASFGTGRLYTHWMGTHTKDCTSSKNLRSAVGKRDRTPAAQEARKP